MPLSVVRDALGHCSEESRLCLLLVGPRAGRPKTADREEPFRSEIRTQLKGRTEALEHLAVEMLARGLSVRDIEDAFRNEEGRLLLSRTAVSEIGERLWSDYEAFSSRDLGEYDIAYLFVDGWS